LKRVALLGCGYIGTQLALAVDSGRIPARLERVYDASGEAALALVSKLDAKPQITENPHLLSYPPVDIVVEAASQGAVRDVALSVLQNRRDLMVMSVGALVDEAVREVLEEACEDYQSKIYLPSGAVGGLDAISAARHEIEHVSITTTKNPASLRGAPHFEMDHTDADSITKRTILYNGGAAEAVRRFPANANVAGAVSIAAGREAEVVVVADPDAESNTHTILVRGSFGSMKFETSNVPEPSNPRTSRLAALSAVRTLYNYCAGGIKTGA
jgi:aspartate dehydrogenase